MNCELVIARGADADERFELSNGQNVLIGRGTDCDIQLHDPSVSRHQCRIQLDGGRVTLIDLASRWGTLVNGRMLKEGELKSGDRITLGDTEIVVVIRSLADDPTLPPRTRPVMDRDAHEEFPRPAAVESLAPPLGPVRAKGKTTKKNAPPSKPASQRTSRFQPPPAIVDRLFGTLKLESVVSIGHTGIVYAATEAQTGEKLAVKIFYPEVLPMGESRDRFIRAMRTAIDLRHDHLVRLRRAGSQRGVCYTVSEFIEGSSAAQLLAATNGAGLDWPLVRHIGLGVAAALQFAYQKNLVHRNVTPSNILIRSADQAVKLGDLSLAKALIGATAFDVTRTDNLIGQLPYLSPEQIEHSPNQNHLSDLYSLGVTLYELLTGSPPFQSDSSGELLRQILSREPEPIRSSRPDVPVELEAIILRLLAKNPQDRFATPMDLWTELQFRS